MDIKHKHAPRNIDIIGQIPYQIPLKVVSTGIIDNKFSSGGY